jgi:hypothetical protein
MPQPKHKQKNASHQPKLLLINQSPLVERKLLPLHIQTSPFARQMQIAIPLNLPDMLALKSLAKLVPLIILIKLVLKQIQLAQLLQQLMALN